MKALVTGLKDNGKQGIVAITQENHLEIALHDPLLPFGSVHSEKLSPIFQNDAVYGIISGLRSGASGSGTAGASDSLFTISLGTTIYSQAYIQSRRRLRYRAGQGVIGRFAGFFSTPVNNSYQVAGFGHAEDGVYFAYKNLEFGILYSSRGKREIQTLTITTASSTTQNITITLAGTAYSIAVTNSSNTFRTAYEISQGTYNGWSCECRGATVIFVNDAVGNKTGTFSISGSTVVGTFSETQAGQTTTEVFVPQTEWNGDKLDGTGASGVTADWTKGNVFQIFIQYLGFGAIVFKVEVCPSDSNNPIFAIVHTLKIPNTSTVTTFSNPSFPFTMAVYSAGSTSNLSVNVGSFAGFIEGERLLKGPRFTYFNTLTNVGATNYQALFTIRNSYYFGNKANQSVINIVSIAAAIKHTSPVTIYLIRNATLQGNPNFTSYADLSCSTFDNAATTCTFTGNNQIVWSGTLGDTGELFLTFDDEVTLQPGESYTLAAKSSTGTPSFVSGSINTREEQ